jgi:drug/metabolite transporter (DMT)-like permease
MNVCVSPFVPAFVLLTRGRSAFSGSLGLVAPRLGAAVIAMVSYTLAIWAFTQGSMGRAAVLRETSVLFAAIMGSVFLKEPFGTRRFLSALLILAGFAIWP